MKWLIEDLRRYPEIAIFLTQAVGFAIGGVKIGKFQLVKFFRQNYECTHVVFRLADTLAQC